MNKQEFLAFSLPYGLKVTVQGKSNVSGEHIYTLYSAYSDTSVIEVVGETDFKTDKYKPILRQLSDITKPIEHKGEVFVPIVELAKMNRFIEDSNANHIITDTGAFIYKVYCDEGVDFAYDSKHNCFSAFDKDSCLPILISNQLYLFLKLIKWHFDIAGLIEKGEAVDVNTLPENPYK